MSHVSSAPLPASHSVDHAANPGRSGGVRRWRLVKLAQLLWLFWQGRRTVAREFPGLSPAQQRQAIQQWAQRVLEVLDIALDTRGLPALHNATLVVSNHLSWLDILVIQALMPGVFVAKSEVQHWPLIGPLARACATIFVERSARRSARAMVDRSVDALAQGWCVVAFPEGTSSDGLAGPDGMALGSFHANIFECAIRANRPVQPISLRYIDRRTGRTATAAHFTGDTTLATSLLRVLGQSSLQAQVHSGAPIAVAGQTRKSLAQLAHQQIRALLTVCALATAGAASTQALAQELALRSAPGAAPEMAQLALPTPSNAPVLHFKDFFAPAASNGRLQITDTLRRANGQTVRLTGYMVQQERAVPGRFMLTPRPVQMSEHADGDADDLPINWVMVYLDASQQEFAVPHVRGLVELTGVLSVGRLEESDGRVSWVRLQLEPEATRAMNAFELANYVHSLQHVH